MGKLFFIFLTLPIIAILLFFPIYLETDVHYDMNRKKLAFSVYGYKFIKLIGGYGSTYKGGFALHVSAQKAILIPYSQLNNERKKFSFIQTFHLKSFVLTTETGAEYLFPVALVQTVLRSYFFMKGGKKEKIENNVWLTDGDVLRISLNCVLFFNIFILLCDLFIFLKEKYISCQKNSKK